MSYERSRASVSVALAAVIAVGCLVAACSGGGSTSGGSEPSAVGAGSGASTAPSVASVPSATPEIAAADRLAALIPATVGDVTLTTSAPDPAAYIKVSVGRRLGPVLAAVGKTAVRRRHRVGERRDRGGLAVHRRRPDRWRRPGHAPAGVPDGRDGPAADGCDAGDGRGQGRGDVVAGVGHDRGLRPRRRPVLRHVADRRVGRRRGRRAALTRAGRSATAARATIAR